MVTPWAPMPLESREVRQSGPLLDEWQIAQAIGRCLYQRLPAWLDETARQQGDPVRVQRPAWVGVWRGDQGLPDEQIPRVMVMCRQTTGDPEYLSDGEVLGWWSVDVGALVLAGDEVTADRLAAVYGAAIRACVAIHAVEHLDMISQVVWVGGRTDALPTDMERLGGITSQSFRVLAGPVFSTSGSLAIPEPDPGPDDQGDQTVVTRTNLELDARVELDA